MITIAFVSQLQLLALKDKLAADHGTTITEASPTTGTIDGHGVFAVFAYDPAACVLTVDVKKHPFYVSLGMIESGIRKALGA